MYKETFAEVRALLDDPSHFTQEANARTAKGHLVDSWDKRADKWCVAGALVRIKSQRDENTVAFYNFPEYKYLDKLATTMFNASVLVVNDILGHESVLQLLDAAIQED